MSIISVKKTPDYSPEALARAVSAHMEALGVFRDLAPGMRVAIKPNLVSPRDPSAATTTHPELVKAVINYLRDCGITDIVIVDSPGGLYTVQTLRSVYSTCGYKPLKAIAELNYDVSWRTVDCPEGFKNHSFNIITPLLEADYIINMPKLKTHSMMTLSGAVKNMFGAVPGVQKPEMHYKWPDIMDFANMLVELNLLLKPNIAIVDAVEAMEGNGPNSGNRKFAGMTFASRDFFTLDKVMADFIGLQDVELIEKYDEMGLLQTPELVGDVPGTVRFKAPDSKPLDFTGHVPKLLRAPAKWFLNTALTPLPKVDHKKCIGCGKCAESCPPHIIKIRNRKARFTSKGCISCFCCQEMCPVHAISIKRKVNL
jgi:uncharacterized protein (DUF362 family)/Pyruvate/2-oxoacid:ferredoxin oxidoreductase delta subunit